MILDLNIATGILQKFTMLYQLKSDIVLCNFCSFSPDAEGIRREKPLLLLSVRKDSITILLLDIIYIRHLALFLLTRD